MFHVLLAAKLVEKKNWVKELCNYGMDKIPYFFLHNKISIPVFL